MAQGFVFLDPQGGQQGLEKFYSVSQTFFCIGLLNLGNIDGTLKHLAAVIILCSHIPDPVDLFGSTFRKVLFNTFFHLLPGTTVFVGAGSNSSQCHDDNQKCYFTKTSHKLILIGFFQHKYDGKTPRLRTKALQ